MAEIVILTHDNHWKGLAPTAKRAAEAVLATFNSPPQGGGCVVAIVLSNDAEIQALNQTYRGKNVPTNVLSFPNGGIEDGVLQFGDVILAYETIAGEAAQQGKTIKQHLSHLVVHGVLHLLGFDHESDKEAKMMERLEIKLLATMGIANPYEDV